MTTRTISIDGQRLWQSLMDLAKIGATPKGGNCRLALTALDGQGRDLVVGWMKKPACRCGWTRWATSSPAAPAATTPCPRS